MANCSTSYSEGSTSQSKTRVHVSNRPHQPALGFKFPKRSFGVKKVEQRNFKPQWFAKWPFLHYDEAKDVVFCHIHVLRPASLNVLLRNNQSQCL